MSNNKQTAVDYLIALKKKYGLIIIQDLEIAKKMEKEQMIDLVYQIKHYSHFPEYAKLTLDELVNKYYNETYGGNK